MQADAQLVAAGGRNARHRFDFEIAAVHDLFHALPRYAQRSAQRIGEIVAGRRAITADTDLRLCRYFGLSNGYWLRAQAAHDTEVAAKAIAAELKRIKPWAGSAA